MVKEKTGFAEGTIDEEFKELSLTYTRISNDTTKFLDECISYKASMLSNSGSELRPVSSSLQTC